MMIFLYFCLKVSIPILFTFFNSLNISLSLTESFKFNSTLFLSKYLPLILSVNIYF